LEDRVLAATDDRLVAIGLERGDQLWRFDAGAPGTARRPVTPFDRPETAVRPVEAPPGKLSGFRVVGGRVFFLRGDRELVALDGETGQLEWAFTSQTGPINPNLLVSNDKVLLQTHKPNAAVQLETSTGRRLSEHLQGEDEDWARPPLPLDEDHVVLVTDRRTVVLLDLVRGVNSWVFRESQDMPRNGPPRLFGDAERLLLLHDGNELIRLDAATGLKRWSRPLGVENLSERPEALALDGERVYWVNRRTLNGALLDDGSLAWSRFLSGPESGWSVDLTERCVLAYPGQPSRSEGELEGLPLVVRRRVDGALVQRVLFSIPVTDVAVRLVQGGVVVATQEGAWSLGERSPVDAGQPDR
jgi:outer membrane protein assembly factor BamB